MAYQGSYGQRAAGSTETDISGWAVGFTFLASMLMMLAGGMHIINGFSALLDNSFYAVKADFALEMDVSTWGWLNLLGGFVMILAGMGLFAGSTAARILTIVLASISVLWNFYSIPYYPVWSILMITLSIGVIWALTAHGRDLATIVKGD
jgi:hypothetical protein